jgi:hypothetical protein
MTLNCAFQVRAPGFFCGICDWISSARSTTHSQSDINIMMLHLLASQQCRCCSLLMLTDNSALTTSVWKYSGRTHAIGLLVELHNTQMFSCFVARLSSSSCRLLWWTSGSCSWPVATLNLCYLPDYRVVNSRLVTSRQAPMWSDRVPQTGSEALGQHPSLPSFKRSS